MRLMAGKCETQATPQSRFKSHYCYGKDLQGEGDKRKVFCLFSLPAGPVPDLMGSGLVFVWGLVGRVGKLLSYGRIY